MGGSTQSARITIINWKLDNSNVGKRTIPSPDYLFTFFEHFDHKIGRKLLLPAQNPSLTPLFGTLEATQKKWTLLRFLQRRGQQRALNSIHWMLGIIIKPKLHLIVRHYLEFSQIVYLYLPPTRNCHHTLPADSCHHYKMSTSQRRQFTMECVAFLNPFRSMQIHNQQRLD